MGGTCEICKKNPAKISIGNHSYCFDCHNKMALHDMGIDDSFTYAKNMSVIEPNGKIHTFEIEHVVLGGIVSWEANEKDGEYQFRLISQTGEDGADTAQKLFRKIVEGVCTKTLEEHKGEWSTSYFLKSKRFDREGEKRIHFASAMTLLGKTDGASDADGTSYLDIVGFIKAYGANPKSDLIELWKRIVFNMAVTNTDDHLRNHAFILSSKGWVLSPLYDVNPVPYGDELSLLVNEEDNSISIDLAVQTAPRFGMSEKDASIYAKDILTVVRDNWDNVAKKYGMSRGQIEDMKPAFEICYRYQCTN